MKNVICLKVEKLISGGMGMGRWKGEIVFVPMVLPEELVEVELLEHKKGYYNGSLIRVIEPSSNRIQAKCPHFSSCGGCQWQHISYSSQILFKQKIVEETFLRIAKIETRISKIHQGSSFAYRNRIQFHWDDKMELGFKKRKSDDVIPVDQCPVASDTINGLLKKAPWKNWDEKPLLGKKFPVFSDHESVIYSKPEKLDPFITLNLLGQTFHFNLSSFFQSNLSLLPQMIEYLKEDPGGNLLLDLYSGVGIYSCFLAPKFEKIIAVEENHRSAEFAQKNVIHSNFIQVTKPVERLNIDGYLSQPPDLLIINPPRTGLTKTARKWINQIPAKRVIYISCDPVTQARDMSAFLNHYEIIDHRLFDFYPQTSHIESVIKMEMKD